MRNLNQWVEDHGTRHRSYATRENAEKAARKYAETADTVLIEYATFCTVQREVDGRWVAVFLNAHPIVSHDFPCWGYRR